MIFKIISGKFFQMNMRENKIRNWDFGNEPVRDRLNVRRELSLFSKDPLDQLLNYLDSEDRIYFLHDDISRYAESYWFFYLSLERCITDISAQIQWNNGPRWVRGRGQKYTERQKKIANKYHRIKYYFLYDFLIV